jgi:hypothetical protein
MVLFLGVMLFAIGTWFYWSTELESKKRMAESLDLRIAELAGVIKGEAGKGDIRAAIDNSDNGLKVQLTNATQDAELKENENSRFIINEYEGLKAPLEANWGKTGAAAQNWEKVYSNWNKQLKDVELALSGWREDKVKREERVATATDERYREEANAENEAKTVVSKLKEMAEKLTEIRVESEFVGDKISDVTREVRKTIEMKPQGRVIHSAPDLHVVRIDIGRNMGVRRGMIFDVYSNLHATPVKKGRIEITAVNAASCDALVLGPKKKVLQDPNTGYIPDDPTMRFSPYSALGNEQVLPQPLEEPKDKAARLEAFRQKRLNDELGIDEAERLRKEKEEPSAPPVEFGSGFVYINEGDWVFSADFTPIVPESVYAKTSTEELLAMRDVNISPLTFYFTDGIKHFRREFLKRLCERNRCTVTEVLTADVNYVITLAGDTKVELVRRRVASPKEEVVKENEADPAQVKLLKKTLAALEEGKKIGADVLAEDEMEAFFTRRQRKQELLRGKTIQPGQNTFFVAGETKDRSVDQVKRFIADHGGVASNNLDSTVDYVVVGKGLDKEFFDKIKRLGLRIIREDELPKFFGLE